MLKYDDKFYTELIQLIETGQARQVIDKILALSDKRDMVYAVSRLYKGIYPHIDKALELNLFAELEKVLKAVQANVFLFDLSLSLIEQTDLNADIKNDLQHAVTLKRMIAHAFKEAIDADYTLTDPLMLELDKARAILQTIINVLKAVLQI